MRVKPNVSFFRLGPKVDVALDLCDVVFTTHTGYEMTVTSCREGNHSLNSKHYYRWWDELRWPNDGNGSQGAFDVRTWKKPWLAIQLSSGARYELRDALQDALDLEFPGEFDVVVESNHIHIEHDPPPIGNTT